MKKFSLRCALIFVLVLIICPIAVFGQIIPFVAHWVLDEGDKPVFTNDVNMAAYDAGEVIIEDFIRIIDFDCNSKFKITATKGEWGLPREYNQQDGNKRDDGSDSDFLIMVNNITPGYQSEGLAPLLNFGNYNAILTAGSDIIGGGDIGGNAHGVENAACDINAKILLDWDTDIVGDYSIIVILTISEVTE